MDVKRQVRRQFLKESDYLLNQFKDDKIKKQEINDKFKSIFNFSIFIIHSWFDIEYSVKYFTKSNIYCFDVNISNFIYSSKNIHVYGLNINNENEVKNFCEAKFGISFPMTQKAEVKGENAHPFFKWANENYGSKAIPKWNFHKIIVGKDGKVFNTFSSMTKPTSKKFVKSIEEALGK